MRNDDKSHDRVKPFYRFLYLLVFSLALMVVDTQSTQLEKVRLYASVFNLAFQKTVTLPVTYWKSIQGYWTENDLQQRLLAKQIELEGRLQRYEALERENQQLLKLLSASKRVKSRVLLAEIVEVGLHPYRHEAILNYGTEVGVYIGQPVITANGVFGQISAVGIKQSRVTLITDKNHGLPVQIQRNGLRTIAQGTSLPGQISVPFLPGQSDIRTDDVLVTSGMGGRFPAGFKVARVKEIITDANHAFLKVRATPFANIDLVKKVLLVWPHSSESDPELATEQQ